MRLHAFLHVEFEGVGCIADWAKEAGHSLTYTRFYQPNFGLPSPAQYDGLIVMGGSMGVYDDEEFAWLKAEKQAIRAAIDSGRKVLGICLGAQLAASVLGAAVEPNEHKEIGWFPLAQMQLSPLLSHLPEGMEVFHWHGDAFTIPYGAQHVLASEACATQAFLWREQVLGLQFHLEMGRAQIEDMLRHGARELAEGGDYVQSAEHIRARYFLTDKTQAAMNELLTRFFAA